MPIPGVTGETFLQVVRDEANENSPEIYYIHHRLDLVDHIISIVNPGDLVILMGAGDIVSITPQVMEELRKNN